MEKKKLHDCDGTEWLRSAGSRQVQSSFCNVEWE
eukprot:SAG11_NODE_27855_length_328_cov_0.681223_1_plen_33_part_10